MAVELATAYISLVPSTRGFTEETSKQLAPVMAKSGGHLGDRLLSGIGKTLKFGAVAVGAAAVGGLGVALTKGFQRLDSLDKATAKLTGLGHSTETVQTIMDNALASVRGTAFGMGEAASSAAQMVASGIKPGEALERTLKAVADAATIAGVDMGSMGGIFAKVAASNKVQMDVINQLHDAGVPALALLAEHMGITAEAASKMASKGEIDFATFQAAMEAGVGGAALESGSTFSGAMDNVMAALGRVGANMLSGIFPQLKDGLGGIQDMLAPLEAGAKEVGAAVGGLFALVVGGDFTGALRDAFGWEEDSEIVSFILDARTALGDFLSVAKSAGEGVFGWIGDNLEIVKGLAIAVGGLAAAILVYRGVLALIELPMKIVTLAQMAWNVVMSLNPIALIIMAILALIAAIIWVATETTFFQDAWAALSEFFTWVWENVLKPVVDAIAAIFTWLWDNILLPVITAIMLYVGLWAAVFEWLWNTILKPIFDAIGAVFGWIWDTIIMPIVDLIVAYVQMWGAIFTWLWENAIKPAVDAIGAGFEWLWNTVIKPVADFIGSAIKVVGDTIRNVFSGIADFIGAAFQSVLSVVRGPINALIDLINGIIGGLNSISVDIPDWVPLVGGQTFGLNIPKIPRLADGGIVQARRGGILANIGEGRYDEAVVPLTPAFMDAISGRDSGSGRGDSAADESVDLSEGTLDRMAEKFARKLAGYSRVQSRQGVV